MGSSGILASPRNRRRALWGGGSALLVGLIVILSTVVFGGSSGIKSPISTVKAQSAPKVIKAKPDPEAFKVARKFLQTAVLRQNLDVAYPLVGGDIKGGMTKKQWESGNIAVVRYPATNTKTAGFNVVSSYTTQMMTTVDLVAKKSSGVKPFVPFFLGLVRAGNKPDGHWLVNYFEPQGGVNVAAGG